MTLKPLPCTLALVMAGLMAAATQAQAAAPFPVRVDVAWQAMGAPQAPDANQYAQLEAASVMASARLPAPALAVANGSARLSFTLPRQGVTRLVIE